MSKTVICKDVYKNEYEVPAEELELKREVKEESGLDIEPGEVFYHATTFFKRNADTPARQSVQLYLRHREISGKIGNNEQITDSEKTYTVGVPEWVDIDRIGKIKFRHSVDLEEIMKAYGGFKLGGGDLTEVV